MTARRERASIKQTAAMVFNKLRRRSFFFVMNRRNGAPFLLRRVSNLRRSLLNDLSDLL